MYIHGAQAILAQRAIYVSRELMGEREIVAAAAIGSWLGATSSRGPQEKVVVLPCECEEPEAPSCPAPAPEPVCGECVALGPCRAPPGGFRAWVHELALRESYELETLLVGKAGGSALLAWLIGSCCCVSRRRDGARRRARVHWPASARR